MHLLFLLDSLTSGGAQRQAVELARSLHGRDGLRASFVVYHDLDFFGGRLREAGIPVSLVPKRARFDPVFPWRLRRRLLEEGADVVHAFLRDPAAWGALALAGLRGRRRPVYVAGERSRIGLGRGAFLVERLAFRGADAVTANAACVAEEIRRRHGAPWGGVHHLPNGIDLADWDARAAEAAPVEPDPGRVHVAMVAGLRREKGHGVLLEAAAAMSDGDRRRLRLWLVGGDTGRPGHAAGVRSAVSRLGLGETVRFVGATAAVPALLARMDALVLASDYEGFPNAVLEAMASRLPVVATEVGDVPALVEEGKTGFLVPPRAPQALARALAQLCALPPGARRALGEAGRAHVAARFDMAKVAAAHRALYETLLASRRA